jgi:hypothetical protein
MPLLSIIAQKSYNGAALRSTSSPYKTDLILWLHGKDTVKQQDQLFPGLNCSEYLAP